MVFLGSACFVAAGGLLSPWRLCGFDSARVFTAFLHRRVLASPLSFPPNFIMAPRRAPELGHDKIEQHTATQPIGENDPIEQFTETSQSSGAVLPAARALEELTGGVDPSSIEGRLAKQRRRMYDEETAQVAVEVLAFRRAQEQMGLARLRQQFSRAENEQLFEIWRRRPAGEAVDAEGNPVQSHEAEVIEKGHEDGNKRLREYLAFLSAKHDDPRHEKSFDCTFLRQALSGALPPLPQPSRARRLWRNVHYRCCYACATCHSEDFIWYSECSSLKPAKPGVRGTVIGQRYNNFDRADVADFDDDYDHTHTHTHRDSGMLPSTRRRDPTPPFYFGSVWDDEKSRWTRRPVFRRKGQVVTTIPVHEWYSLCSKVITYRRRQLSDQVSRPELLLERRNSSRKTRRVQCWYSPRGPSPHFDSDGSIFVADMDQLDTDRRARVMVAFEQWQVSYGYAFWDMALNDTPLTNCLFKVTDSLGQHFICRNVDCTSVIHNHHWLRQISTDYPDPRAAWSLHLPEDA